MVNLISSLRAIKPINVLVIGDFVLDSYIQGFVQRISPEAPVPVLHAKKIFSKPGMAGNVALNLSALGANIFLAGRIGLDNEGLLFLDLLTKEGINCDLVLKQNEYKTPVKQRMIAHSQQLMRVDFESSPPLSTSIEEKLIQSIKKIISDIDVIAVSDYLKGCLSFNLLKELIHLACQHNIPVIVDPKGKDFSKYKGATLIKPNLMEAYAAAHLESSMCLDKVAKILLETSQAKYILITRSSEGISLYDSSFNSSHFATKSKEVIDVTGAGDTVLAMVTMALGNNISSDIAAQLANIAASIVIKKVGCVAASFSEIAEVLLKMHTECKIFDEDHLFALAQVLGASSFTILMLEPDQDMSSKLFEAIRQINKNHSYNKLVIYIEAQKSNQDFISLLSSLHEVDFIIEKSSSLQKLCRKLKPQEIFSFSKNSLYPLEDPFKLIQKLKDISQNMPSN